MNNEYLILVNAQFPMCAAEPTDLVSISYEYPEIRLRRAAQAALAELLHATGCGDGIIPVSGYRSRREQTDIYESALMEYGLEFTEKYVALPGCSEHQTGLAVDLARNQKDIDFLCPEFPYHGICAKFRKLAPKYGFIERYPKGKEAITGIAHEPWHFRYVGCPHAEIITAKNLTLEEYLYDKENEKHDLNTAGQTKCSCACSRN